MESNRDNILESSNGGSRLADLKSNRDNILESSLGGTQRDDINILESSRKGSPLAHSNKYTKQFSESGDLNMLS